MACTSRELGKAFIDSVPPIGASWISLPDSPSLLVSDNPEAITHPPYSNDSGVLWQHTVLAADLNRSWVRHRVFFWHENQLAVNRVFGVTVHNESGNPIVVRDQRQQITGQRGDYVERGMCLADALLVDTLNPGGPTLQLADDARGVVYSEAVAPTLLSGGQLEFLVLGTASTHRPAHTVRVGYAASADALRNLTQDPVQLSAESHARGSWGYSEIQRPYPIVYEVPAQGQPVVRSYHFSNSAAAFPRRFTQEEVDIEDRGFGVRDNRAPFGAILRAELVVRNLGHGDALIELFWQPRGLEKSKPPFAGAGSMGQRIYPGIDRYASMPHKIPKLEFNAANALLHSAVLPPRIVPGRSDCHLELRHVVAGGAQPPAALVVRATCLNPSHQRTEPTCGW